MCEPCREEPNSTIRDLQELMLRVTGTRNPRLLCHYPQTGCDPNPRMRVHC